MRRQHLVPIALAASLVAVGAALLPGRFRAAETLPPIRFSAVDPPAGGRPDLWRDFFWVKAEADGPLPEEGRWRDQYVVTVFRDGEPFYARIIDAEQIEAGRPFDVALRRRGRECTAALVTLKDGRPDRPIPNALSFVH